MSNQQQSSAAAAVEVATVQEPERIKDCETMEDVRRFLRKQIYGISDNLHELHCKEFDHAAEFALAQFLYSVVPVFLLKDLGLLELADNMADKLSLQNRLEVERG